MIGRIKRWKILSLKLNTKLIPYSHKLVRVLAATENTFYVHLYTDSPQKTIDVNNIIVNKSKNNDTINLLNSNAINWSNQIKRNQSIQQWIIANKNKLPSKYSDQTLRNFTTSFILSSIFNVYFFVFLHQIKQKKVGFKLVWQLNIFKMINGNLGNYLLIIISQIVSK